MPWLFLRKGLCLLSSESIFPGLPLLKLLMTPSRTFRVKGNYHLWEGAWKKLEPLVGPLQAGVLLSLYLANTLF